MGKITDETVSAQYKEWKQRQSPVTEEQRQAARARIYGGMERKASGPGLAYRGESFDSLGDLLGSGIPVKVILRDTGYGVTFTIKAVFQVSQVARGMYMHGTVKHPGMVPEVIDRLLRKGDWHEDRYFKPD